MRKVIFAPSILGADPLNIESSVEALKGTQDWLHLDIMDGHFVRNLSFGPSFAAAMRRRWPDAFIDTHLMIDRLDTLLPLFIKSGSSLITVHAETESQLLYASLIEIKNAGLMAGVSICPATPVANIRAVLELADLVLIMSVTPGFGGQKFIESSLEKVRELVSIRAVDEYKFLIEIDGGINEHNVADVALAGCDVIVAGSAVFESSDPAEKLAGMRLKVREALGL